MKTLPRRLITAVIIAAITLTTGAARADNDDLAYSQTNLVSNGTASTVGAPDMHLKNPWGIAMLPGAPFWIADNGTGFSTLYDGHGTTIPLVVTIPPPKNSPAGTAATPTGIVWNPNGQLFLIGTQKLAPLFIFATEDGTISAWNPTVSLNSAVLQVDNSGNAVYKGLALATNSSGVFLYATNFQAGTVDVFDSKFQPARLSGSFTDPRIPAGYAPFGIALIDGNLFVTYALQGANKHDDVKGPGHGFVDVFDTDGNLITRFASRGVLNSPWGIARAPQDFGPFSSRILIGNFGDGRINGFSSFGDFRGQLRDAKRHAIQIDGLWSIVFGASAASDPNKLYFTAGPDDETNGLFGFVQTVPLNDHDRDNH